MKKMTQLLTLLILLSSCFKTDLDSNSIPFSYSDEEGNDNSFIVDYNLTITGSGSDEYFGKNGENLGNSPVNSKALISDYSFCIKALELKDVTGAFSSEKLLIRINGHDYNDYEINLSNANSRIDAHIKYFAKDKLFVKKAYMSAMSGTAHLRVHFGSCED